LIKIREALPDIFERPYAVIDPSTKAQIAMCLLAFHEMDALPVGFTVGKRKYVISGYSCLSRLLQTAPVDYARFLDKPSQALCFELATVPAEGDLESLLEVFEKTRFGFAWVEDVKHSNFGALASLRDLLPLFSKSIISTDMSVGEVATSPIFSLSKETSLKQALNEMIERKVRRVLISETQKIVSDRQIIDYVFRISKLDEAGRNPSTLLDADFGDLESVRLQRISSRTKINKAAAALYAKGGRGGCLICEEGVVTPWDVIMKPWRKERLAISESVMDRELLPVKLHK